MRLELEHSAARFPLTESFDSDQAESKSESAAAEIIKRGISAAREGNRPQARILLKHGLELDPESEVAWLWLASISEYPEELLVFLDHVLLINPENRRAIEWKEATEVLLANTFVQRGIDAANEGRNDFALQCFNDALKYDEQNQIAWLWITSLQNVDVPGSAENDSPTEASSLPSYSDERIEFPTSPRSLSQSSQELYVAPHSESVVLLRPIMEFSDENENGPTQELVFPESLLESNPFESFAAEMPPPAEELSLADYSTSVQPEVVGYEEPMFIGEDSILADDTWNDDPRIEATEDCDIQEVLAAASLDEFDVEPRFDSTAALEINEPQQWFPSSHHATENFAVHNDAGFCPFCKIEIGSSAISCSNCDAMLSMSDVDTLLTHKPSDPSRLRRAVQVLDNMREAGSLDAESLVNLAVGHLNLGDMDVALSCMHEASALSPNNVLISSQLNTLAIRIDEVRSREERHPSVPVGKTILVVDDSPTIRKLISGKLEKGGHEVYCAEDGQEAVEMLKQIRPHLILLDITMPRMDGYQVCKTIRSTTATKDVPVVMISGKDGFFDKVRGKMAGSTDYITKPFGPEALMKALEKYLTNDLVEAEIAE
jgi:twitching motility two-component system response regulator PilG